MSLISALVTLSAICLTKWLKSALFAPNSLKIANKSSCLDCAIGRPIACGNSLPSAFIGNFANVLISFGVIVSNTLVATNGLSEFKAFITSLLSVTSPSDGS